LLEHYIGVSINLGPRPTSYLQALDFVRMGPYIRYARLMANFQRT